MQDIFIKDSGTQNYNLKNSEQTSCPLLILKITEKLIKSLYKGKNQFQGVRESVVPMNVGFVRLLMTIASYTEMNSFKEFVCLNTFQNLTKKEIHELKEDYMLFLPYSFEFSNSIGYYKEHFGKEYIEKETLSFFFKNVKIGANLCVLSTIDRNTIKSNLTKIYTSLEGFLKTKHSSISFVPIIHCLSGIAAEHCKITSKFAETIVNAIFKHPTTLFDDTNQPLQDLFIKLCSQFPEIVLKNFITIVDCTLRQNLGYGCKVFFTLGLERIRKLDKLEAYSKSLWNQLKKSKDAKSAGLLIYFVGSDPKEVLEYLQLEQYSLPFGDLSGEKVLLKLIEADDKRYLNILHNPNHLITGKEGQQIAIEWAQTKEDFQSLFKLVVETATNLETSLWCSDFIKYFIGSEYEDLAKQCLSDILLINRSRELFDLMGKMNRYFDIDSSILKYFNFIHDYQEVAFDLLFSVNNIPNNFLDTQEYFSLNFKTQLEVYHQLYFSPKSSLSTPMDYCNRELSIIHQKTINRILPGLYPVSAKELCHVVDLFKDIPIENTISEPQILFEHRLNTLNSNRKKVLKYITKLKNTTINSNLKFLFDGEGELKDDKGYYHSYKKLKEFYNVYQCESLSLSTAPIYKFEKDLVNLKHLYLTTSQNSNDLFYNSVEEFVKHCTQLQSFTLNVKDNFLNSDIMVNIVKLILEHNSGTLSIVQIFHSQLYFPIDYENNLKEFKNSHNEFTYEIKVIYK
ncbi:hypothetical protein DLAC_06600 [Tieghemostelium lacteum]|uniref:Uncharacterized protein n=1 Tax=Tieghemostelium lacteum TaxID=361077 RepID=A0A151ZF60_TIELA|nr:hypothetical protein DLAC_06600 [Tieghemostelium lacteum]|eukprot:KYQ92606.1 hypothetical protein DLAC_06600 [Tieghemostelium lacteum]